MNYDYETLRIIYWGVLVLSILGFVLCEGINLGVGMLVYLLGKNTEVAKVAIASVAPTSLLQLAWLMAVIAVLFATWPIVYAVIFSCLPWLLLIMLLAWLPRPVGFLFRDASDKAAWQNNWDKVLSVSSFLITAILGVIAGNLLKGIPFHLDSDMRIFFLGDVWGLLNPFALLVALINLTLLLFYAASFLQLKVGEDISKHCQPWILKAGVAFMLLFALAGLWLMHLEGYHINSEIMTNADSNPLHKFVKRSEGLWLDNYEHLPVLWLLPGLVFSSTIATLYFSAKRQLYYWAFIAASVAVTATVLTLAVSMFPFLLPSNRSLNSSLTLWDASASFNTLTTLLGVVVCALPIMALTSRFAFSQPSKTSE
ncbi:cytochrome d ubiquinol oxidase subunit II [Methylomonas sp. AM2-LC]|uniref:cytochrome d ubiquinol oxidase subunit II n=1 Tax=Methylomonas sp. AM2-LC TaxID=3153301 RepID=UPI00326538D9